MYLYNDNLVVILSETSEYQPVTYNNSDGEICDCMCYAIKTDTVVKCFDISDRANPQESFTHKLTGDYISSRVTDGKLITVAQFRIPYDSVQADDFDGACEVVKDVCVPEYSVNNGELQKIPSDRIKVFDENIKCNIKPYTKTGDMFLLIGKGYPNGKYKTNLIIEIKIKNLLNLNKEQIELVRKIKEIGEY